MIVCLTLFLFVSLAFQCLYWIASVNFVIKSIWWWLCTLSVFIFWLSTVLGKHKMCAAVSFGSQCVWCVPHSLCASSMDLTPPVWVIWARRRSVCCVTRRHLSHRGGDIDIKLHQFLTSSFSFFLHGRWDRQTDTLNDTMTDAGKNYTCFTQISWRAGNYENKKIQYFTPTLSYTPKAACINYCHVGSCAKHNQSCQISTRSVGGRGFRPPQMAENHYLPLTGGIALTTVYARQTKSILSQSDQWFAKMNWGRLKKTENKN